MDFAALTQAWIDLIMIVETHLSTSPEQDDRAARKLRESRLRLREIEDDRKQVAFELFTEQESRATLNLKHTTIIASLREQLQETQRAADDALVSCQRSREQDLHTIQSTFASQVSSLLLCSHVAGLTYLIRVEHEHERALPGAGPHERAHHRRPQAIGAR